MQEKIIRESIYFKDLNDEEYEYALKFFGAKKINFNKGDVLNTITKPLTFFGLIISGNVQVHMDDMDGQQIIMAVNGPGQSFGESLCYLNKDAPVYIVAASDGAYLQMNTKRIDQLSCKPIDIELNRRFISILAQRALQMNNRIQILSKISIRDKLLTFFAECSDGGSKNEFELAFNRNDMAVYLGVNRSALSRELSAMQAEGLIEFHKNKFKIISL